MDYQEAKNYLFTLYSFEKEGRVSQSNPNFNLNHYREFLSRIGNPHEGLKYVHIAGSKGKGSTCNFVAAGIAVHDYNVGLFTSPSVKDLREQVSINGEWISEEDFAEIVSFLKTKLEKLDIQISYFEFINTIAFIYFKQKNVDFVVLEVGLGGLYDSTNVVDSMITVLTQVELEHRNVLGDSIEEILANKLGIMKDGVPMIIGPQKFDLRQQIQETAREKNVDLIFVDSNYDLEKTSLDGTCFDGHKIALIGEPYILSSQIALNVCSKLLSDFDEKLFWKAAATVKMPGRFEVFEKNGQTVIFDMAHTQHGAMFLRSTLDQLFPGRSLNFLISMLKDKDVEAFFKELVQEGDEVVLTQATISRAMSAQDLASRVGNFKIIETPVEAFEFLNKKEILVCTGSHFLLHDLYALVESW